MFSFRMKNPCSEYFWKENVNWAVNMLDETWAEKILSTDKERILGTAAHGAILKRTSGGLRRSQRSFLFKNGIKSKSLDSSFESKQNSKGSVNNSRTVRNNSSSTTSSYSSPWKENDVSISMIFLAVINNTVTSVMTSVSHQNNSWRIWLVRDLL